MNKPLVSVIVPCYDQANYLDDALESVIAQTYDNWECIVVNDGSTDNTEAVASRYKEKDSRVKYCYQDNQGLAAARNMGYSLSKGSYIQFLDADDMIAPQKIEEQVALLESDTGIGVCYSNYQTFSETPNILEGRYSELTLGNDPLSDFLFKWERGLSIPIHSALFRKSLFAQELPFDQRLKAKEDWFMWVKVAATGVRFYFLDKDYAYYRTHINQMTKDFDKMLSYSVKAYAAMLSYLVEKNIVVSVLFENAVEHLIDQITAQKNQEIEHKNQEIEHKNQEIETMLNSKSWRMTAPLRKVSNWFKQLDG